MKRLGAVAKTDAAEAPGALRMLAGWAAERGLALLVEKETADLVPDLHLATARKASELWTPKGTNWWASAVATV